MALLMTCIGSVAALVVTTFLGLSAGSWAVASLCLLVMLAILLTICVQAGRRQAWPRLWGVVTGVLLAIALFVAAVFYLLSGMAHSGF